MNYLFAVFVSLFLVTMVVAADQKPTFCTTNNTECELANINITCVEPTESSDCVKDVANGKADLALSSANSMVVNADKLKIVIGLKLQGLADFVQYYGLAVVQKGSNIKLTELKGKDSCHTGVGRTVGWKIPVGYLLYTNQMTFTKNQYKSAADFFGKSCAQGIKSVPDVSQEVKVDLCSLCNKSCDRNDPYASYEGAFKCMAEGNKDRVGFVKETTADDVLKDGKGKYGSKGDYELLCTDGSKMALEKFKDCHIDKRPASAVVTSANKSNDEVNEYAAMLKKADIKDLIKGGLVYDTAESLKDYSKSVTEYVGSYGKHVKALQDGGPPPDKTAAASIIASFALQVAALLALALLA